MSRDHNIIHRERVNALINVYYLPDDNHIFSQLVKEREVVYKNFATISQQPRDISGKPHQA